MEKRNECVLNNGEKAYAIKLEHLITKNVASRMLWNKTFEECSSLDRAIDFYKTLTKKSAMIIIKKRLLENGRNGSVDTTMYESSEEHMEIINQNINLATSWIDEHFPYFNS